jgi:hypothetical protein
MYKVRGGNQYINCVIMHTKFPMQLVIYVPNVIIKLWDYVAYDLGTINT